MGAAPLAEKRPSAIVLAWEWVASKHNSSSASHFIVLYPTYSFPFSTDFTIFPNALSFLRLST